MEPRDGIAFLTGSAGRVAVLRALASAPCRPCELREQTEASRTAIHRALSGFEEFGWVRKRDERYVLTAAGRDVLDQYERLAVAVERGDRFSEFLAAFPHADELPFPFDGSVGVATPTEPHAAQTFFFEQLPTDLDHLRGFTPVLTPELVESFEPTVESASSVELVYDERLARRLREVYPETLDLAVRSETVTAHVVTESLDAGLVLVDGAVLLGAYGPQGSFRACLHSTDDRLYDWAADWFDRTAMGSSPLAEYAAGTDAV